MKFKRVAAMMMALSLGFTSPGVSSVKAAEFTEDVLVEDSDDYEEMVAEEQGAAEEDADDLDVPEEAAESEEGVDEPEESESIETADSTEDSAGVAEETDESEDSVVEEQLSEENEEEEAVEDAIAEQDEIAEEASDVLNDADTTWQKDYDYLLDDDTMEIELWEYMGSDTDVVVPAEAIVDGKTYHTSVFGIAFMSKESIKSIRFEDGVGFDESLTFSGCSSLTDIDLKNVPTSQMTDMSNMFDDCSSLTSIDLSGFDTSKVTNMWNMFAGCSSLTSLDLSSFDTSNVEDMSHMFRDCSSLSSLDLSGFKTQKVKDMSSMFSGCEKLSSLDVSKWDTSSATEMDGMFWGCSSLPSLDVSSFNTSKVTNMMTMFNDCSKLTSLDVSGFNTSNVTDLGSMFSGCSSLKSIDVKNFDTSKAKDISTMFYGCTALESLDLTHFDTSNVGGEFGMFAMFNGCSSLTTLDLTSFDPSRSSIAHMFIGCEKLKTIYVSDKWVLNASSDDGRIFEGCTSLVGGNGTKYNASTYSTDDIGYAHIDVEGNPGFLTGKSSSGGNVQINIKNAVISPISTQKYTGKAITPTPNVLLNGRKLRVNKDYTFSYSGNTAVGTAKITATGKGSYKGSVTSSFKIEQDKIAQKLTKITPKSKTIVSGQTSKTTVTKGGTIKGALVYTSSNTAVATVNANTGVITAKKNGKAKISVYAKASGNYQKSNTVYCDITVSKPAKPTLSKVASGSKSLTVSWKKTTCSGYIVEYAKDKKFKSGKTTKTVKGGSTQKYTIKNLKKGTYYVRVYAYGSGTSIRSAASNVKSGKAK